jgi:dihydrofolate synthase/folylpolyglutamate synthase
LEVPLRGRHQVENAALAIGVTEILSARGFRIDEQAVTRGLKKTRWEGRLEILRESPALVVDGAHNPAGITVLRRALEDDFSFRRLILVFGVLRDKDYRTMLRRISPIADQLILTRPGTERALPARNLRAALPGDAKGTRVEEDPREALREAFRLAGKKDLICATGSLYLVGDIKKAFLRGMKKTGI